MENPESLNENGAKSTKKSQIKSSKTISSTTTRLKQSRSWHHTKFGRKYRLKELCCLSKCVNNMRNFVFTFGTYNLLAPALAEENRYLYLNVNEKYLDWNYRRHTLLNEIRHHNADIYCFQEMQKDQYYEFFYPRLRELGYYCLFKKRTGDKPDGCSIVFKKHKFQLISHEAIEFFQKDVETLNKDNVALLALLQPKYGVTHERLCIATTHILFSPKRGDIKLAQMQKLLAHMDRMAFKKIKKTSTGLEHIYYPTILCGDMNSVFGSPFCEFLTESKLSDYANFTRVQISGQIMQRTSSGSLLSNPLIPEHLNITDQSQFKCELEKRLNSLQKEDSSLSHKIDYTFGEQHLYHPFQFKSAYEYFDGYGNEYVTTCLPNSHDSVDYIFYHADGNKKLKDSDKDSVDKDECKLKIISTLKLFNKNEVRNIYLPNKYYASDHFLLCAKFLFTSNS